MIKEVITRRKDQIQRNLFSASAQNDELPVGTLVKTIFDDSQWRVKRFRAGLDLVIRPFEKVGVDVKKSVYNHYYDSKETPIGAHTIPLIGMGANSFVFLVEKEKTPPYVIKMDRPSIRLSTGEKEKRINDFRSKYSQLQEWFIDIAGFVVPNSFIISKLPFKNQEAIGIIQPFIPKVQGFFEDFTDDQLVGLFEDEPALRKDFISMTRTTFKMLDESNKCMDFVGKNNLCLTKDENKGHRLKMIDSCDILEPEKITHPLVKKIFEGRKDRLTDLLQRAEDIEKS